MGSYTSSPFPGHSKERGNTSLAYDSGRVRILLSRRSSFTAPLIRRSVTSLHYFLHPATQSNSSDLLHPLLFSTFIARPFPRSQSIDQTPSSSLLRLTLPTNPTTYLCTATLTNNRRLPHRALIPQEARWRLDAPPPTCLYRKISKRRAL